MGSSVDARWSARFGVALSVRATCACGAAGECGGGVVRHYTQSGRSRVDGVSDDARSALSVTHRRADVASTACGTWNGVWRFVLRENPGRSHQKTGDSCAALYESMRGHLEAVALLERQPGGSAAEKERVAAGGYCSKKDCKAQHGSVTCYKPMRMPQSDSARTSASPTALARARERA